MPRKIVIPNRPDRLAFLPEGWEIFYHRPGPTAWNSPLWIPLKAIDMSASKAKHRRGRLRVFWLYWGVDEGRFRFGNVRSRFEQHVPAVYAAAVEVCRAKLTPAKVESEIGAEALAAERVKRAEGKLTRLTYTFEAAEAAQRDAELAALLFS